MTQKINGQFVPLPRSLLENAAWRSLSLNGRRLIDFLMIEWLRHNGKDNGKLLAPYDQLVEFGITRRLILPTVKECERHGLIETERRGYGEKGRLPSRYRLTFLSAQGEPSTNDWLLQNVTSKVPERELTQFPKGNSPNRQNRRKPPNGQFPKGNSPNGSRRGTAI
jgi:hypothetical protein